MTSIYFVTSLRIESKERIREHNKFLARRGRVDRRDPDYDFGRLDRRTWGYVHDLDKAKEIVERNKTDIHECNYRWACIEGIKEGWPNSRTTVQLMYEWQDGKYVLLDGWPDELSEMYDHIVPILAELG